MTGTSGGGYKLIVGSSLRKKSLTFKEVEELPNSPKGIELRTMLYHLHKQQLFTDQTVKGNKIVYNSCTLCYAVAEPSKFYCALELFLAVCTEAEMKILKGKWMGIEKMKVLGGTIESKAMKLMLQLEGRSERKKSKHTAAFLGVGLRVLNYKKSCGGTSWSAKTLIECMGKKSNANDNKLTVYYKKKTPPKKSPPKNTTSSTTKKRSPVRNPYITATTKRSKK